MKETIAITNFGGRLTRNLNGDLNSGFAKFTSSFGYDPFSKPMNLTWLEQSTNISGSVVTDMIVAAKPRLESGQLYVYAIGDQRRLYKITSNSITSPNLDTSSIIATLANPSFNFGASMEFFGTTQKIYIGADDRVVSVNFDGSGEANVGTVNNYSSAFRPLKKFLGYLVFGNQNNIGLIDSTGTVVSSVVSTHYEQLSPNLPSETYITDLDLSIDGNYLLITTSGTPNEDLNSASADRQSASASDGGIYKWNGIDAGITAVNSIPSYAVTSLQTYLDKNYFFSNDSFGAALSDGSLKILTMPNNKSPFANATVVNGNFVTWVTPEVTANGTTRVASLYYFGKLDEQSEPGLFRVLRLSPASGKFVYQTPVNLMINNSYSTTNLSTSSIATLGYGKHYFSKMEVSDGGDTKTLQRFLITPTGSGTPQLGVYETQTQLFSKKASIEQIRVYTEPTVANNGFQIDLIGSDGGIITNGTFNYSFVAGTNEEAVQGSMERINFNPKMNDTYALGLRITNTGTANMTIKKIEIDWAPGGK